VAFIYAGSDLFSHTLSRAVPSAAYIEALCGESGPVGADEHTLDRFEGKSPSIDLRSMYLLGNHDSSLLRFQREAQGFS